MAIDPTLVTTERVGELPPALPTLLSKVPHEIDTVLNYFTIQQLLDLIAPLVSALQYQVIDMDVPQQFVTDNFDLTPGPSMGLGKNLMEGYAIRNGNNGTVNADGRSNLAYGVSNAFVGVLKGSADSVLVSHTHTFTGSNRDNGDPGALIITAPDDGNGTRASLSTVGESGVGKNYHPVVVTLSVMKL